MLMKDKTAKEQRKRLFGPGAVLLLFSALMLSVLMLSGCSKNTMSDGKNLKGYSLAEISVIAMAEKNRYEAVCTDQIWKVKTGEGGTEFASYLTEQIKSFMDELKIMNALAAEKNVSLDSKERSAMAAAAEAYYGALSQEDISHLKLTQSEVQNLFEDYCLSNKLVEALTKDVNLEVSDSEAKVITLMEAKTGSAELAAQLRQSALAENADFQKCAEAIGVTAVTKQLGRAEKSKVYEDAAFSLTTGQVSDVIADGDFCYVLKCVNDYDGEATKARKDIIYRERKKKAFQEIYADFESAVTVTYTGDPYKKLDLSGPAYAKDADFFAIYEEYVE